eukprot:c15871_g1_i1.p1 GENE.c15871_g1_i1~~c15871_g1_i1.p1  ORF type:complete len:115 (+),score=20.09 c15871_g1_i1:233-577(+)
MGGCLQLLIINAVFTLLFYFSLFKWFHSVKYKKNLLFPSFKDEELKKCDSTLRECRIKATQAAHVRVLEINFTATRVFRVILWFLFLSSTLRLMFDGSYCGILEIAKLLNKSNK